MCWLMTTCHLLSDWTLLPVYSFLFIFSECCKPGAFGVYPVVPPISWTSAPSTLPPPAPAPGMGAVTQNSFPSVLCTQAPPNLFCSLNSLYCLQLLISLTSSGWAAGSTAAGCMFRLCFCVSPVLFSEFLFVFSFNHFWCSVLLSLLTSFEFSSILLSHM